MSFADVNRRIKASGGNYVKLSKKSDGSLQGKILDVVERNKQYQGKVVTSSKTGEPRVEWVFTLDVNGETKKWAANESAQFAIRGALDGRELKEGGLLQVVVTEDSVQGQKSAEYKVKYTDPVGADPFPTDTDDSPF
jgi:hypothetical protein